MDESWTVEDNYHEQRWTTWFLWKEGVKPSDILCQLSAICREKALAHSTVFNCVWPCNSGKGTVQAAVHRWYRSTLKEAPKMVVTYNFGRECIELAVINIQPKDNKICILSESKSFQNASCTMSCSYRQHVLAIFRSWKFFKCVHEGNHCLHFEYKRLKL